MKHAIIFSASREDQRGSVPGLVGQTSVCAPTLVGAPAAGRNRDQFAARRVVGQAVLPAIGQSCPIKSQPELSIAAHAINAATTRRALIN